MMLIAYLSGLIYHLSLPIPVKVGLCYLLDNESF